jgi:hypothetical protein
MDRVWLAYARCDDIPVQTFLIVAPADWGQDRVAKALADMGFDADLRPHTGHIDSPCGVVKVVYLPSWKIDTQRVGGDIAP